MREIKASDITSVVRNLCIESNIKLPDDIKHALQKSYRTETSPIAKYVIKQIIKNYEIAEKKQIPICQDTGIAVVFIELGQDVHITDGDLYTAINDGVRFGYKDGYLRKSVVSDPFTRNNTFDNTPAMIHTEIVPGNKLKITVLPKGAGAENMSVLKMLNPSTEIDDIKKIVIETVINAGANACPPVIVGIGLGGTFDTVTLLAKKSLLRQIGSYNRDPFYTELEKELLAEINKLGIGPQGFGGKTTALAVFIEQYPCHIASLPIAVNLQCHACRHTSCII